MSQLIRMIKQKRIKKGVNNFFPKNRKAAMEMSVGTIVTIVLLMSVLILGIFLVKNIFSSAKGAIDLTDQQLEEEINSLFGDDNELVIYPKNRLVEVKQGELQEIGIGIKNLLEGTSGTKSFSYEVLVSDASNCAESEEEVESWIVIGKSEENIPIPVGDLSVQRVRVKAPVGSSLCIARFRVNVNVNEEIYATDYFDLTIEAK